MPSDTQQSARAQQRQEFVDEHAEQMELAEVKHKQEGFKQSQASLKEQMAEMAEDMRSIQLAADKRQNDLLSKVSQLQDTVEALQQPRSGRTRCVDLNVIRVIHKFVWCAIEFCTGSSQPEPFPKEGTEWPTKGSRRLMRWNFDQSYTSEVNRAQTEQLWDVMSNNPSAVNLPTWISLEELPKIGTHVDLYKEACQQYFRQFKVSLRQREAHEWVDGGRERHEGLMEERRKAGASEIECRELEAHKVKMDIWTGTAQSDPLVRRAKRSKLQAVSQVFA